MAEQTTYPKIKTLYDRDPQTFAVIPGQLRCPEFGLVSRWLVTEKIDGTNVRVHYHPHAVPATVRFYGRTENAHMPTFLLHVLTEMFPVERFAAALPDADEDVWLYGEGYGPKIQKSGGSYRQGSVSFRLFDVRVGDWWLSWDNVESVAEKLGIQTVPVLARNADMRAAVDMVERPSATAALDSGTRGTLQEGIVCRTDPLLFTRQGDRVVWKLKGRDFRVGRR